MSATKALALYEAYVQSRTPTLDDTSGASGASGASDAVTVPPADEWWRLADAPFVLDPKTGLPYVLQQRNLLIAIAKLGYRPRFNALSRRKVLERRDGTCEVLQDSHVTGMRLAIDRQFHFLPSKEFFHDVVDDLAHQATYHPVVDYLDGLPTWDGVPRVEKWLVDFARAADSAFVRAVATIVLVAAVRRARWPGAKFDEMLVLEGPQGTLKSSLVAALCPDSEWFSDSLPLQSDVKVQLEATLGKWIVEAGELAGMSKADDAALKAFLSRQVDEARMAYGREPLRVPRGFVLIGTTNDTAYLKYNNTRRYWPVAAGTCDAAGLVKVRDQLWAEACVLEARGTSIRLGPQLWSAASEEQDKRRVEDPVRDMLEPLFMDQTGRVEKRTVWKHLGYEDMPSQQTVASITRVLTDLGWDVVQLRTGNGKRAYFYARGTSDERNHVLKLS